MALIAYYLADHALWDMQHGGNRHASDIDSLAGAFGWCLAMFNKYCVGDCPKDKPKPPEPIDPLVPVPYRIPGPFLITIDPCILTPYASYCPKGPGA